MRHTAILTNKQFLLQCWVQCEKEYHAFQWWIYSWVGYIIDSNFVEKLTTDHVSKSSA